MCAAFSFALIWVEKSAYVFKSTCSWTDYADLLKLGSVIEDQCFIMQFCDCNDKKKCSIEYFKIKLREIDFDLESVVQR